MWFGRANRSKTRHQCGATACAAALTAQAPSRSLKPASLDSDMVQLVRRAATASPQLSETATASLAVAVPSAQPAVSNVEQLVALTEQQQQQRTRRQGGSFVGQLTDLAAEYHEQDFNWNEHAAEVGHLVQRQQELGQAAFLLQQQAYGQEHGRMLPGKHSMSLQAWTHSADGRSPREAEKLNLEGSEKDLALAGSYAVEVSSQTRSGAAGFALLSVSREADRAMQKTQGMASAALTAPHCGTPAQKQQSGGAQAWASNLCGHAATVGSGSPTASAANSSCVHTRSNQAHGAASAMAGAVVSRLVADAPPVATSASAPTMLQSKEPWEAFYRLHVRARFFKERRYLLLEFPVLTRQVPPLRVAELGCGCGSSLLPILRANPTSTAIGADISATCVAQLQAAAAAGGIARGRLAAFVADCTWEGLLRAGSTTSSAALPCTTAALGGAAPSGVLTGSEGSTPGTDEDRHTALTSQLCAGGSPAAPSLGMNSSETWASALMAEALLLVFTLSAVGPEAQAAMLRNAYHGLQPGGVLLLRDHGLYDMVQLRIPAEQWVGANRYVRGDGTHAFFFTLEDLQAKAKAAGFLTKELRYVCVANRNRRTGSELRRVFVHGIFEKPKV